MEYLAFSSHPWATIPQSPNLQNKTNPHPRYYLPRLPADINSYFHLYHEGIFSAPNVNGCDRQLNWIPNKKDSHGWYLLDNMIHRWKNTLWIPPHCRNPRGMFLSLWAHISELPLREPEPISTHRDIPSSSSAHLLSVSLGCEMLFITGVVVRVRSMDVVIMGWHARRA